MYTRGGSGPGRVGCPGRRGQGETRNHCPGTRSQDSQKHEVTRACPIVFAGGLGVRWAVLGCRVGAPVSGERNECHRRSPGPVSAWGSSFLDLWDTPPVGRRSRTGRGCRDEGLVTGSWQGPGREREGVTTWSGAGKDAFGWLRSERVRGPGWGKCLGEIVARHPRGASSERRRLAVRPGSCDDGAGKQSGVEHASDSVGLRPSAGVGAARSRRYPDIVKLLEQHAAKPGTSPSPMPHKSPP
jgi:hypothetical protein